MKSVLDLVRRTDLLMYSLGIMCRGKNLVSACVLVRTEHGRFNDVLQTVKQIRGVTKVFPVLGRYDVVVDLESKDFPELASNILRLGKISGIVFTETLAEIKQ